jgi:hypothetical protein
MNLGSFFLITACPYPVNTYPDFNVWATKSLMSSLVQFYPYYFFKPKMKFRHSWFASPCKGPANSFKPAENDKYGSENADPSKWVAWVETFTPSWSLKK